MARRRADREQTETPQEGAKPMTTLALAIEKQARKLPAAERERLAERLLAQMREERLTAVDEAWVAEAERRFSAWKRKRTRALPADKVIADIRKDLRR
jgi:putative addiction module component (TIGR02574 family)